MSTVNNTSGHFDNDSLWVVTHRVGTSWRCLFVNVEEHAKPTFVDALQVQGDGALKTLLEERSPSKVFTILSGADTVCRTTTLPDVEDDQINEALRLQAEARLLGGTPNHRRAMAPLDASAGETNRVGLIVAYPENTDLSLPQCLEETYFIPDAVSVAALLDGFRPTEPILIADPVDGTVTMALSHANGAALRATLEDHSNGTAFMEGIIRIVKETATLHNHTESFTQSLVANVQSSLAAIASESPMVILPKSITEGVASRLQGTLSTDDAWWRTWGIAVGGVLAATGTLHALTTMQHNAPVLHPSSIDRCMHRLGSRSLATRLVFAAVLLLAFGPTIVAGIRVGLLEFMNPDLQSQYAHAVEERQHQIVYKELGKTAWPMTKIIADITNNVPVGIDIESIRVDVGDPISIRGRAIDADGMSAAQLIALMQENLQRTGVFKDIQFSYDPAGTYGDRDFDIWASVVDPLRRPRYTAERDFARWTLAMRQDGTPPDEILEDAFDEITHIVDDDDSPLSEADADSAPLSSEVPPFIGDHETRERTDRTRPRNGSSDAQSRSEVRVSGGTMARIPEPLTPEQIAVMSEGEARIALKDVTSGLSHVGRDDEAKKRLRSEMRLLLDRLKEVQR